jgi:hypothetical protein
MVSIRLRAACLPTLAALLVACAAQVPVSSASLSPLRGADAAPDLVMQQDLPIRLSTGYTRTVPAGSRWRPVGVLPQGTVYRPVDTVFAIEGRHVHEAYLVVRGGTLHGFYRPGEGKYSPLATSVPLPLETGAQR